MIQCYLTNVNTGKAEQYCFRYWKLHEVIGRTFKIKNEYYVCTTAFEIPDKDFINPNAVTMLNSDDELNYETIGVSFLNGSQTYHYFITIRDCFGLGKGSRLYIKTPYSDEQLVEITEPYIKPEDSHATKAIEIVRKVDQSSLIGKRIATVRYIDGKSISKPYTYEVKEGYISPSANHLYWIEENKSLVIVDEVNTVSSNGVSFREKIFLAPAFKEIKDSFGDIDNININVRNVLKHVSTYNLNYNSIKYIEKIVSSSSLLNQLTYGGNVTNSLTSTGQAAQCATIAYNELATAIATHKEGIGNWYNIAQMPVDTCTINNDNNKGEDKMNMNKMFKNFEFGKINTDAIKFSINGLAFKQADGSYATYNAEKHEFTDVSAFVMDTDFIFAMPVAIKDLKKGDIVKHLNKYVIIEGIFEEDGTIKAIDPLAGEEKVIIPIKNMFGFNYYTKIMNIFDGMNMTPNAENPFGNFLPFLMMRDGGFDDTMMLAMMMQNGNNSADFMSNPFMMMALLKK